METAIQIEDFTENALLITAALCLLAVLVAWYTVRGRIQFSQIILGAFCYVMVMLLENIFTLLGQNMGLGDSGLSYGIYFMLSVVFAREIVRYLAIRYGVRGNFDGADAAIGFAIGFAGLYLLVSAAYYFNCYAAASEYLSSGMDAFLESSGEDADEALELLETISSQNGWQFILTGVNRVFFLVRELSLCVLMWYAMADGGRKMYYWLVPLMHLAAMVPDGLFQAGMLTSSYVRDIATCVISAGIAVLAAWEYNSREDQVAHFQVERLRARRRR